MSFPSRLSCLSCLFLAAACSQRPQAQPLHVVTFNKDIAPIVYSNCATCHRPIDGSRTTASGDPICFAGAPFSVLEYKDVAAHAKQIASAVERKTMPPWLPAAGYGDFAGARTLSDAQIALLRTWAEQGAPEGDPAAKPPLPDLPNGWQLGQPDLVVEAPKAFTVPASGGDLFRNFVIPVPFDSRSGQATRQAMYVRAIELRADNPRMFHHASVGVDRFRVSRKLDGRDGQPGFAAMPDDQVQNVYGWSPGKAPYMEPADRAWTLEKGSDLVVQMHLLPTGKPEPVRPVLGLFVTDQAPAREPFLVRLESKSIDIPAGEKAYVVEDSYVLPADVDATSIYPHAHYHAKDMQAKATLPDGSTKWLLWIKQWDFRWQDQYRYASPVALPAGTTLSMRITYDNSKGASRIKWGPKSADEMGAMWLEVQPHRAEDLAVLMRDYNVRALKADIAGGETQVRVSPDDPLAHNYLATKYLQAGRVADAVKELNEAVRLNPRDAEAHSNLATAYQAQGRVADSVREGRLAVSLAPKDDRVHFNLASALEAGGATTEAIDEFARAVTLNPDNGDAHFNLGVLLGARNQIADAVTHLRRAAELDPRNADAHRNLGLALAMTGKLDEGIREAKEALRLQPQSPAAQKTLGDLLRAQHP
ncbi:MAG TPA: tetratricopeptide repeat protein [Vicinamibacterales bacterium]|nr:tetratricopeptide repeat protein [Vicinamibacterales bacterium]